MEVRQVRPTDAPLVLSLALDGASHVVVGQEWPERASAAQSLVRALVPLALSGRMWLARDEENCALLEAQPHRYLIGWDVIRLAVRGDACPVVPEVVQATTAHLQSRGVPRLFARCSAERSETLNRVGFQALAREYVLLGPEVPVLSEEPIPGDSRYRMPSDAWPLHQLERESSPPLLQQLAGMTTQDWSQHARDMSEIVVERNGQIVAWVGWSERIDQGLRRIGMLVHPRHKDLAPGLLHQAIRSTPPGSRLVARVREYHDHVLRAFEDAGFVLAVEETLMVKHAQVELARVTRSRMRVSGVPSIQAFPILLDRTNIVARPVLATRAAKDETP